MSTTFEVVADNPKVIFGGLLGRTIELTNGNLVFGKVSNLRIEHGKLVGEAEIEDEHLFAHYGKKAFLVGFPVKFRE